MDLLVYICDYAIVWEMRGPIFFPAETPLEFIENNSIIIFFSSICSLSQWFLSFYKSPQLKNGFLSRGMSRQKCNTITKYGGDKNEADCKYADLD